MEQEIKEVAQSETEIIPDVKEEELNEETKVGNIYVENDPEDLERMLGIAPSKDTEEKEDIEEPENTEEPKDTEEDSPSSEQSSNDLEEPEDNCFIKETTKPLLFSDFMEEDRDSFTYLVSENGSYHVNSIPLEDKKSIRQAVKSANYIFRYPKYILKDKVLGFSVENNSGILHYNVFFPEYKLSFDVGEDYIKPYSESFKDYFEDLITRVRPDDMILHYYENAVTLTALKVIETGILEVNTDEGIKTFLLNNPTISFHRVLDYIRELSDLGEDTLTLKFLPEFFVEI